MLPTLLISTFKEYFKTSTVQNQNKNLEKCQKKTFSFFLKRSCVDVAKEMFEEDIAEGMLIKYMTVDVGLPNHTLQQIRIITIKNKPSLDQIW